MFSLYSKDKYPRISYDFYSVNGSYGFVGKISKLLMFHTKKVQKCSEINIKRKEKLLFLLRCCRVDAYKTLEALTICVDHVVKILEKVGLFAINT